jgi:hypothetical protein
MMEVPSNRVLLRVVDGKPKDGWGSQILARAREGQNDGASQVCLEILEPGIRAIGLLTGTLPVAVRLRSIYPNW